MKKSIPALIIILAIIVVAYFALGSKPKLPPDDGSAGSMFNTTDDDRDYPYSPKM